MSCKTKTLNTNNFLRWVRLEDGTTLSDLQANGMPENPCDDSLFVCGLNINVTQEGENVTFEAVFTQGGFETEFLLEGQDGFPVQGYDWIKANKVTATLEPGLYLAKFRKQSDDNCTASDLVEIASICDIGLDVFVNGSNVLIAHYYESGNDHNTEYQIEKKPGPFDTVGIIQPVPGYSWAQTNEISTSTLEDGTYIAKVRKQGVSGCQASKEFTLANDYLEVSNFLEQNNDTLQGGAFSNPITIKNNSTTESRKLNVEISGYGPAEINDSKTGSILNAYIKNITISAGQTITLKFKFATNQTGINQYPTITLRDITNPDSKIRVKAKTLSTKDSIYIKYLLPKFEL